MSGVIIPCAIDFLTSTVKLSLFLMIIDLLLSGIPFARCSFRLLSSSLNSFNFQDLLWFDLHKNPLVIKKSSPSFMKKLSNDDHLPLWKARQSIKGYHFDAFYLVQHHQHPATSATQWLSSDSSIRASYYSNSFHQQRYCWIDADQHCIVIEENILRLFRQGCYERQAPNTDW